MIHWRFLKACTILTLVVILWFICLAWIIIQSLISEFNLLMLIPLAILTILSHLYTKRVLKMSKKITDV